MLRDPLDLKTRRAGAATTDAKSSIGPELERRAAEIVNAVASRFRLSCQEANVLMATSRGETKKEISFALGITVRTVEYYWTQIFKKLHCNSQVEVMSLLFRYAIDTVGPGIY